MVTMYLTVSRGNVSENTDHSWKEINNYSVYDYDTMGVERYQAAALLQSGMKMVHSRERSVMEKLRQMPQCSPGTDIQRICTEELQNRAEKKQGNLAWTENDQSE